MKILSAKLPSLSRVGTLVALALAFVTALFAPVMAIQWSLKPFPGFFVEQTLVVSNITGSRWQGQLHGLMYPMRVTKLNGEAIQTSKEYADFFAKSTFGQRLTVNTILPDGSPGMIDGIILSRFPFRDFLRLFWLPYGISLVYLFLGVWIYRLRGGSGAGRAFSYFTACSAMVSALIFAVWTSHRGTALWTLAIAQLGGAIIGLSIQFPTKVSSIANRGWVRGLAYALSFLIAGWGLTLIYDLEQPWAYVRPWLYSYLYGALGIGIFIISMVLRLRSPLPVLARQQVRMILLGAVVAFAPLGIWFGMQAFVNTTFNPLILIPFLFIFPLLIAFAMVRYRLWDFDLVIRRTIIYTALTVTLVVIYFLFIISLDSFFDRLLGKNNFINVVATLIIVLIYTPLHKAVQRFVDHRWFTKYYHKEEVVQDFARKLRTQVDLTQLGDDLIEVIEKTMQPETILFWAPKVNQKDGG